jgi:gamma-glutamyltranspeptidase/glutathione hydrolase
MLNKPCTRSLTAAAGLMVALALVACSTPGPGATPAGPPGPIASTPRVTAASTAHPLATQAALRILAEGGTAIDATVAAQMVLGLVEPQSSGIGGGLLMMVWDAQGKRLRSYDGLASAPARSTKALRTDVDGRTLPLNEVARGGRSVGVPGAMMALELAHRQHGRLPWAQLFEPAIALATQGYPLAPYARDILARDKGAVEHPEFRHDHFDNQGEPHPAGTLMRNPAYAQTLRALASQGVTRFWREGGAQRLVAAAQRGAHPSLMTVEDVLSYKAVEHEPVCAPVRVFRVCMFGPPSFGGVATLQMLALLAERHPNTSVASLQDPGFWHLYAEAGRLAQADRRHHVGDPAFVAVPVAELLAAPYLRQRAALIDPQRAAAMVRHGSPGQGPLTQNQPQQSSPQHPQNQPQSQVQSQPEPDSAVASSADQTSQIVIVDAAGNVASTTTTINLNFGSRLRVDGYVLNNALTNFGPASETARPLANQMAAGKRPVTSMAPLVVFDAAGQPVLAGGSAGGGQIVDYIARALIEMLWLGRSPHEALAGGHVTTALAPRIQLEAGTAKAALAAPLRERGHDVVVEPTLSGAGFIKRVNGGWIGAADPRRDGVALGR